MNNFDLVEMSLKETNKPKLSKIVFVTIRRNAALRNMFAFVFEP